MNARLRQLGLPSVRARALAQALAALGAITVVASVPLAIWGDEPWAGPVFVITALAGMALNVVRTLPSSEAHRSHPGADSVLSIICGDLLDQGDDTVVMTVNDHFDIGAPWVSAQSLVGQLVDRWCDGEDTALRAALRIPDGEPGRLAPAPIGTVEFGMW